MVPIPSSRLALFVTPDECSIVHTICVCSLPILPQRLGLLAWGMGPAVTTSTLSKCFVHVLLASPLERYSGFQGHRVILRLVLKKNSSEKPCSELPNLLSRIDDVRVFVCAPHAYLWLLRLEDHLRSAGDGVCLWL